MLLTSTNLQDESRKTGGCDIQIPSVNSLQNQQIMKYLRVLRYVITYFLEAADILQPIFSPLRCFHKRELWCVCTQNAVKFTVVTMAEALFWFG
jgi:hypothetical protein